MKITEFVSFEGRKQIFAKALVFFLVFLIFLTFFSNTINNFTLPKVKIVRPSEGQLVREIRGDGNVEAKETIDLFLDADIAAKIEDIDIKEGDEVRKDTLIITLREDDIKAQLQQEMLTFNKLKFVYDETLKASNTGTGLNNLKTSLSNAQERISSLGKEYDIIKSLYEAGAKSAYELWKVEESLKLAQSDYDNKQDEYSIAKEKEQADIKKYEYDLAIQQLKIDRIKEKLETSCKVKSPVNGVIKNIYVSEGSYATSSTKLCTITVKEKGFEFNADIDLEDADFIKADDKANVQLKVLGNEILESKVTGIRNSKKSIGEKKEVYMDIQSDKISGGEKGEVYIEKITNNYKLTVSNAAVVQGMSETQGYVWVIREKKGFLGNQLHAEMVEITILDSDNYVTAFSGNITENDEIIYKSDKPLQEDCRVQVEISTKN